MRVLPFRTCFVGVALQIVPCAHGFFCNCTVLLELECQQSNVVHHAGNEQCGYGVEYANFSSPLDGVGLTGSSSQGTDTRHIETDGKNKRQTFGFGKFCSQDLRDTNCSSAGGFGPKGRADKTAASAVQGIQPIRWKENKKYPKDLFSERSRENFRNLFGYGKRQNTGRKSLNLFSAQLYTSKTGAIAFFEES